MRSFRLNIAGTEYLAPDGYSQIFIRPFTLRTGPVYSFPDNPLKSIILPTLQTNGRLVSPFYRLPGDVVKGADRIASGRRAANQCAAAVQYPVGNSDCFRMLKQNILTGLVKGGMLSASVVCHDMISR